MRRRRIASGSTATKPGVMLLGGPWHGKIQVPPDQGNRIAIPVMRSQPVLVASSANLPPPSYDTEYYERHAVSMAIERPLPWQQRIQPTTISPAQFKHPALRPVWSDVVVWAHQDYLPEINRAWEVVKETIFNIVPLEAGLELAEPWAVYRGQKMYPCEPFATEISVRLVDRALDELDQVLGFER